MHHCFRYWYSFVVPIDILLLICSLLIVIYINSIANTRQWSCRQYFTPNAFRIHWIEARALPGLYVIHFVYYVMIFHSQQNNQHNIIWNTTKNHLFDPKPKNIRIIPRWSLITTNKERVMKCKQYAQCSLFWGMILHFSKIMFEKMSRWNARAEHKKENLEKNFFENSFRISNYQH